jgi:sugar phosphate isomerase/epimerase
MPRTGDLDWKDILAALDEVGYDGYYNMENVLLHFGEELLPDAAEFSVKVMRNLLSQY